MALAEDGLEFEGCEAPHSAIPHKAGAKIDRTDSCRPGRAVVCRSPWLKLKYSKLKIKDAICEVALEQQQSKHPSRWMIPVRLAIHLRMSHPLNPLPPGADVS